MISFLNASIITCVLTLFLIYEQQISIVGAQTVSSVCFGCICEAASGCNATIGCDGSVCGPFRITWNYWADAGKPTLDGQSDGDAYSRCVNDVECAARTVEGYMTKFSQDCNGDGTINCDDFLRIHRLGGYGCSGFLNAEYEDTYKRCMQAYGK
ncbi:unnamed protein product [Xylocopa violacea]|uniref:lysozyme n=1 Tax=Xylocopa violacea TaxID=135666 RepID=A0ABP1P4I4_XYLVO